MNMDSFKKWVCTAVDMEDKGRKFYEKAAADCQEGFGKDIFAMLRDDEIRHVEKIREIEKALDNEQNLEKACTLPDEQPDSRKIFRAMASGAEVHKACTSTEKALETGLAFEQELIRFYQDALDNAGEGLEKDFLTRMVAEEKQHYALLEDLNFYYKDPEGWAMDQDRAGLDGA